ncbi:sensor histidine kinase KdpD [Ferrimonas sp. SCSIO 43195]|uniref:sensor histidine kinase n=1 Tax=Ferrimonas sp. SCSIO 43195 TaxID=2822844 RepID=UPI002075290C|nr:ATP-binding protein [Ferrimonas sp. SCSIO 43195]USD38356.1 sensor histidine kinase N-terminal domain-containing protein [Ferrimonas sp. SCSIO 43195]
MNSIRSNLIVWLAILLLVTNGLGFINALWTAKGYYQKVYDGNLAQRARIMLQLINETPSGDVQATVRQARERFVQLDLTARQGWLLSEHSDYADTPLVQYQVWQQGQCVSVNGLPCEDGGAFHNINAGFSDQSFQQEQWRTFTIYSVKQQLYLTVGYPNSLGRDVLQSAMWASWGTQMMLLTPLTILMCSVVVGINMSPLRRFSRRLQSWPNITLPATSSMPKELHSTVTALTKSQTSLVQAELQRHSTIAQLSQRMIQYLHSVQDQLADSGPGNQKARLQLKRAERLMANGSALNDLDRPLEAELAYSNLYREAALSCARHYQAAVARGQSLTLRGLSREGLVALPSTMVEALLDNLIDNALKASPDDGEIIVSVRESGPGKVSLTVADSGPGLERDKFNDAATVAKSNRFEVGMGLLIVRSIVSKYQGELSVGRSQLLGGSQIRCRFTLHDADEVGEHAASEAGKACAGG